MILIVMYVILALAMGAWTWRGVLESYRQYRYERDQRIWDEERLRALKEQHENENG